jgi:hypothetical protein
LDDLDLPSVVPVHIALEYVEHSTAQGEWLLLVDHGHEQNHKGFPANIEDEYEGEMNV